MLILLLTIWRVQMLEQVISILVSFPNGARRNLCNTGGPAKRYEMWMAISGAMCKFAGLGRNRTLRDVIVCWTYTMTDPARGMGYARLYRADTSSKTESLESHGAKKGNPVRQLRSFGVKCARCRVGEGGRSVTEFFLRARHQHFGSIPEHQKWRTQRFRQLSRRTRTHHKCH